jgi:hypothetical protein
MQSGKEPRYPQPIWWTTQHTIICEERMPALKTDFQRRAAAERRAELASQGPDDPVFQRSTGSPRNVPIDRAYAIPDNSWEVGTEWEQVEPAIRYGVGARLQYPGHDVWTEELEALLRREWEQTSEPSPWEKVKRAVRHGFESMRKHSS